MTARGHILLALPGGMIAANSFGIDKTTAPFFIGAVLLGSLAPDIDEPGSWIGRRLWFLAWPIKLIALVAPSLRHRGVTHFLILPIAMMVISVFLHNVLLAAFAIGWLMHTVGDLLTVGGIRGYFYPLLRDKKIVLLPDGFRFYTGGVVESALITLLLGVNGYIAATGFVW